MNFYRFSKVLSLLALCSVVLVNCKDDDEDPVPQDSEKPSITLTTAPDEKLFSYNIVAIKGSATDNVAVTKVQVFQDNAPAPFKEFSDGAIDLMWDTRALADGQHTLRFVAFDDQDNQTEKIISVKVRNTLISFKVAPQFLQASDHYYIFIANEQGQVLSTAELQNGSTYTFKAPDNFTGQSVTLNLFEYTENSPFEDFCYVRTYAKATFGEYEYTGAGRGVPELLQTGTSVVHFSDLVNSDFSTVSYALPGYDMRFKSGYYEDGVGLNWEFTHTTNSSAVLFTIADGVHLKYQFIPIAPADEVTTSSAAFLYADEVAITVPEATTILLTQIGRNSFGTYSFVRSKTVTRTSGAITAFTLPDAFDSYITQVRHRYTDYDNFYYLAGQVPTTIKQINGSIQFKVGSASVETTITGAGDVAGVSGSESIPQQLFTSWIVYMAPNEGTNTVIVPVLPQSLIDLYHVKAFADLPTKSATLTDYSTLNGYADYMNNVYSAETQDMVTEYTSRIQYKASTGGRVSASDASYVPESLSPFH